MNKLVKHDTFKKPYHASDGQKKSFTKLSVSVVVVLMIKFRVNLRNSMRKVPFVQIVFVLRRSRQDKILNNLINISNHNRKIIDKISINDIVII